MFILRHIVNLSITHIKCCRNNRLIKIHNYLYACIDAIFFLLPDLAILHWHNQSIIDEISNNSWWIVMFIFNSFVVFWVFPRNFISVIKIFLFDRVHRNNSNMGTRLKRKYKSIYNRESYLFIGVNIIFADLSLFCLRPTDIGFTIMDFIICWVIEDIIVKRYRSDSDNFRTVPLVRKSEWKKNDYGELIPKPLICIPYEKHLHYFREHEYLEHLEVLGFNLTIISLVSVKFVSCLMVMIITYTYFIGCTNNEKMKTL